MRLQQDLEGVLALSRAGTRVALVEVPRSPRVDSLVPDEVRTGARLRLEELVARHGWRHALPPQPPAEHYCDPMHMHEEGRETYSRWLAGAIEAWLVPGDG
jgi:hypothetical protein